MKLNVLKEGQAQGRLALGDAALNLLLDIDEMTKERSRLGAKIKECREALAQVIDEAREAKGAAA